MTMGMDLARQEILAGPEYFDCQTLSCRIRRAACADRWCAAQRLRPTNIYDDASARLRACRACELGREHSRQYAPAGEGRPRPGVRKNPTQTNTGGRAMRHNMPSRSAASAKPWRKPCRNCAREMAIVREGFCGMCARAAHGRDGEERRVALEAARQKALRSAQRAVSREAGRIFRPGSAEIEHPGSEPATLPPAPRQAEPVTLPVQLGSVMVYVVPAPQAEAIVKILQGLTAPRIEYSQVQGRCPMPTGEERSE